MSEISVAATVKDTEGNLLLSVPLRPRIARLFGEGEAVILTVRSADDDEPKTRRQERGFHAMITPWADDAGHRIEDLKLDLLGEIFGWNETPSPLTGRLLPLEPHTSTLSKTKYSTLIERTLEIAARCGYVLEAPSEYTARKLAEQEKLAKREKKGQAA